MDKETLQARADVNREAVERYEVAHAALLDAIWEAHDEGWRQVDICGASGLTRERVRQICDPDYRERAMARRARR